ncbi:T-cell activation inhibitor, mitochondrial isoform X1 [Nematostella vectensis]|uniref:T-cell activation inhibitor, mitochondrial isoform X1 n=1 Tax=Nematostella vectensis TaxID=45351 RepID=UPI0020775089|nr:T-cell activation inhibitor, mitochondrial isoform X1 [Nematostella vectensis]
MFPGLPFLRVKARSLGTTLTARLLSNQQTKAALKPFYFAVHPDLFGQHPTQRATNEDSLKRLNSYIDNLENKYPVSPTHLTFYIKDDEQVEQEKFKTVRISLYSRDLGYTVSQILKSCGMIKDFVAVDPVSTPGSLDWLQVYSKYGDKWNAHKFHKKPEITLHSFLDTHSEESRDKLRNSLRDCEEVSRLSRDVCEEFGLAEMKMDCGWSCSACLGSLRNFTQLCREKRHEILTGRRLHFTSWTGVDPTGRVMLGIQDVPQFWLSLFGSLEDYDVLVHQVPLWEARLSTALGGLRIHHSPSSPSVAVTEYLHNLHRLVMGLRRLNYGRTGHAVNPGTYKDLHASVLSPSGSLTLSSCGEIRIPASTPGDILLKFLEKSALLAHQRRQDSHRIASQEEQLISHCMNTLSLHLLTRDECVSAHEMITCCNRLAKLPAKSLSGLRLVISKYYHANSDGTLCIPWDWK